jgi:glutamyl/glutaminyl-tRNA synthetase
MLPGEQHRGAHRRYRGRVAPSPTGFLHVGHARTFFTAFERAQTARGTLIMRMEDLDLERSRTEYADAALEDLRWLGIAWHEGPDVGGPFAPYTQSQRMGLYRHAMQQLLAAGWIYPCRCSRKDLAAAIGAPHEDDDLDDEPLYPGTCRAASIAGDLLQDSAARSAWRFRVPDGEAIEFTDGNFGVQRFVAGKDFGDFLVWRRDVNSASAPGLLPWDRGFPSYQLACVVDDHAMQITEVVRGADLLKSTARQILLNRALGFDNPAWFHCELILDADGKRLAKRHNVLSIRTLRERGLTPQQILHSNSAIPE